MLSLPRYVIALVLWITLFFNIERLHINKSELIQITLPVYVLVAGVLVLGLVLPQWFRVPLALNLVIGFIAFAAVKVTSGRPFWGDAFTFVTLFELMGVLITVVLAHRVGQMTADFVETLRGLFTSDLDGRVHPPELAESILKREMQSARRQNHPLTILLVEADTKGAKLNLTATAQEIQRVLARRLGLVTLTRLFAQNLRSSDMIVNEIDRGRWLLMTSTALHGRSSAILDRLGEETKRRHGIRLKYGVASFPEEGITFEDLIARAEQDLQQQQADRRADGVMEPMAIAVEKPSVNYSSYSSSKDL